MAPHLGSHVCVGCERRMPAGSGGHGLAVCVLLASLSLAAGLNTQIRPDGSLKAAGTQFGAPVAIPEGKDEDLGGQNSHEEQVPAVMRRHPQEAESLLQEVNSLSSSVKAPKPAPLPDDAGSTPGPSPAQDFPPPAPSPAMQTIEYNAKKAMIEMVALSITGIVLLGVGGWVLYNKAYLYRTQTAEGDPLLEPLPPGQRVYRQSKKKGGASTGNEEEEEEEEPVDDCPPPGERSGYGKKGKKTDEGAEASGNEDEAQPEPDDDRARVGYGRTAKKTDEGKGAEEGTENEPAPELLVTPAADGPATSDRRSAYAVNRAPKKEKGTNEEEAEPEIPVSDPGDGSLLGVPDLDKDRDFYAQNRKTKVDTSTGQAEDDGTGKSTAFASIRSSGNYAAARGSKAPDNTPDTSL